VGKKPLRSMKRTTERQKKEGGLTWLQENPARGKNLNLKGGGEAGGPMIPEDESQFKNPESTCGGRGGRTKWETSQEGVGWQKK